MNKTDNSNVSTKKDLADLGSELRKDLKKTEKFLRVEILRVEEKVESLEEKFSTLDKKIDKVEERLSDKLDKIMNVLDGFVGRVDDLTVDNEVGTDQINKIKSQVANHEARINSLETSR